MSLLIKNGRIIDGSEYKADVFIDNGKIMRVGENLDVTADVVIYE